jgi:recombination protein RecT
MNAPNVMTIAEFRQTLSAKSMQEQLIAALPKNVTVERFVRILMTAVQQNQKLLQCDRSTLWSACMRCAQDGLLPDGREAALVDFKGSVQYLPMYQGLLKKLRNSGELETVLAEPIFSKDDFEYQLGDEPRIMHRPNWGEDRGTFLGAYSVIKTKDGGIYRKVMSKADIDKVRAASRSGKSEYSPWTNWYEGMACKTVLRANLKFAPSSTDLDGFEDNDIVYNQTDDAEAPANTVEKPAIRSKGTEAVREILFRQPTEPEEISAPKEAR